MSLQIKAAKFRGDPGVFGFLGGIAKRGLGLVSNLGIPGVSAAAGFAAGRIPGPKTVSQAQLGMPPGRPPPSFGFAGPQLPVTRTPGFRGAAQRFIPGGATGFEVSVPQAGMQLACPSGWHPNKAAYFLRDGSFVAEGSRCVRNRRRNPGNMRAFDRSVSRVVATKSALAGAARVTVRPKCPAGAPARRGRRRKK